MQESWKSKQCSSWKSFSERIWKYFLFEFLEQKIMDGKNSNKSCDRKTYQIKSHLSCFCKVLISSFCLSMILDSLAICSLSPSISLSLWTSFSLCFSISCFWLSLSSPNTYNQRISNQPLGHHLSPDLSKTFSVHLWIMWYNCWSTCDIGQSSVSTCQVLPQTQDEIISALQGILQITVLLPISIFKSN